jgi:inward rectifier potassium channel
MLGLFGFALVTGLIFAKFGRPNARVMFSKNLVITQRYGKPCLMFRVANARSNEVVEASVHVACLKTDISPEGHRMRRIYDLALLRDSQPLFALSWLVIHEIDDASPLSGLTAEEMGNDFVMLIVTLTGIDGTFASTVHARQLYVYADVAWGYRFVDVITTDTGGAVTIDYRKFDEIEVDPAWTGEVVAAAPPADR